jgi:hypothetical protein
MRPHGGGLLYRTGVAVLCAGAVMFALPRIASGECAAPAPCCEAYKQAALVFLAKVDGMQPAAGPMRSGVLTQVRFRILEWFKGSSGNQLTFTLKPSSEEFDYVTGKRVLVYATRSDGGTWSTACTRTRQVSPTDPEPQVVRALQRNQPGGVIDGNVQTAELLRTGRAGAIAVVLRRDGALVSEMRTDFAGRFQTGWLAPGVYELSVKATTAGGRPREVVVLRDSGCISIGSIAHQ